MSFPCERCAALGYKEGMSWDELSELNHRVYTCSNRNPDSLQWICPAVDKELRRADQERMRRSYYERRKAVPGSASKTTSPTPKSKTTQKITEVDLDAINL